MMKITYKCDCLKDEADVFVRWRRAAEDIVAYMDAVVTPAVSEDHGIRSPFCMKRKLTYIKIPIDENAPSIGYKPVAQ